MCTISAMTTQALPNLHQLHRNQSMGGGGGWISNLKIYRRLSPSVRRKTDIQHTNNGESNTVILVCGRSNRESNTVILVCGRSNRESNTVILVCGRSNRESNTVILVCGRRLTAPVQKGKLFLHERKRLSIVSTQLKSRLL
jgi:hypothetical protein